MSIVTCIRKRVLQLSQSDMADALGVTQATISRWEAAGVIPAARQRAVRDLARDMGRDWSDSWFFEPPSDADVEPEPLAEAS